MKTGGRIALSAVLAVLLIPLLAVLFLRTPAAHRYICRKVSDYLSARVDGSISVQDFSCTPFNTLILYGILVQDSREDTLLRSNTLAININPSSVFSEKLKIHSLDLEETRIEAKHINDSTTNIEAFINSLDKDGDDSGLPWKSIRVGSVRIKDLTAAVDSTVPVSGLDFELKGLTCDSSGLNCTLKQLSSDGLRENGISDFTAKLSLSDTAADVRGFRYADDYSDIKLSEVHIGRDSSFRLVMEESKLGLGSLSPILEGYSGNGVFIKASLTAQGSGGKVKIEDMHVVSDTEASELNLSGLVTGLEKPEKAAFHISAERSRLTAKDVERLYGNLTRGERSLGLSGKYGKLPLAFNCLIDYSQKKADARGDFTLENTGSVRIEASGEKIEGAGYSISGTASTDGLNLKRLTGDEDWGKLVCTAEGSAMLGKSSSYFIDDLQIQSVSYKGCEYRDIRANGQFGEGRMKASATSGDPAFSFNVNADCDLHRDSSNRLSAFLHIGSADLKKMHITDEEVSLGMRARCDLSWTGEKKFLGRIDISDLRGKVPNGDFHTGNISYKSEYTDSLYRIAVESDILNANYVGTLYPVEVYEEAKASVSEKLSHILPHDAHRKKLPEKGAYAELDASFGDARNLLSTVMPSLYINPGTKLSVAFSEGKNFVMNIQSGLLAYKDLYLKDTELNLDNLDGAFNMESGAGVFQLGIYKYAENVIRAALDSNTLNVALGFDNAGEKGARANATGADLRAVLYFEDSTLTERRILAELLPSTIDINGSRLNVSPSRISLFKNRAEVDSIVISGLDSRLSLKGRISDKAEDTARIEIRNFDLSSLNGFILDPDDNLQGRMTGYAAVSGMLGENPGFFTSLDGKEVCFGNTAMGELKILSKWDSDKERINVLASNTDRGKIPLNLSGWYRPDIRILDLNLSLDSLKVAWVPAIAPAVFSGMSGSVSGDVKIHGSTDSLEIESRGTRLNDIRAVVEYTHVPYFLNGEFDVSEKGVDISRIKMHDEYGSSATARGGVFFNNFKGTSLDMSFSTKNILAVNTTYQEGADGFYGKVFGTGNIRIHGPVKGILIDIDALVESGEVHIPITDSYKRKNSLLTFTNAKRSATDAYDSLMNVKNISNEVNVDRIGTITTTKIEATPATSLIVDLSSTSSDMIRVCGSGALELISGNNNFDVKGSYTIAEGNCRMSILGISAKDFTILEGGVVNFNGDVDKTEVNATAQYSTKASIEPLIGDNSSVSTRRTVNSNISVSGNIYNPEIKFKVDIPDLEPATKSRVENALSTDEKNLRQSLALLVSGSFVPDENGGIVNSSSILYSNASEILSSQVNNIFRQLDIPVDLGFKYQQANSGADIFDVAISTQLFHNRLTINGSIGNQKYMTGGASSDIVGNIDVEIKLNKSGRIRLNLFSHAADKYSNYLDQTQRNGIGVVFQEDFNTWRELWNNILRRSRKRENQSDSRHTDGQP